MSFAGYWSRDPESISGGVGARALVSGNDSASAAGAVPRYNLTWRPALAARHDAN